MAYITTISLFLLQILTFFFMYNKNSEYLCILLLMCLHIIFLLQFVTLNRKHYSLQILPSSIFGSMQYFVPFGMIFLLLWILVLITISFLINTYRRLYASVEKGINLGDSKNYDIKNYIKIMTIFLTFFLWIVFCIEIFDLSFITKYNFYPIITTNINLIPIVVFLVAFYSIYLAIKLHNNTRIITNP